MIVVRQKHIKNAGIRLLVHSGERYQLARATRARLKDQDRHDQAVESGIEELLTGPNERAQSASWA